MEDHTHQVASLDIHSDDFNSLPPEVQHDLLLERQQLETHTHHDPATLPQVICFLATSRQYITAWETQLNVGAD